MSKAKKQIKNKALKDLKRLIGIVNENEAIDSLNDEKIYEYKGFSMTGEMWKSYKEKYSM